MSIERRPPRGLSGGAIVVLVVPVISRVAVIVAASLIWGRATTLSVLIWWLYYRLKLTPCRTPSMACQVVRPPEATPSRAGALQGCI